MIIDHDSSLVSKMSNIFNTKCLIPEVCKVNKIDQVSSIKNAQEISLLEQCGEMPIILLIQIFNCNICSKISHLFFFRQYIIELLLKGLHRLEYRGYDRLYPKVKTLEVMSHHKTQIHDKIHNAEIDKDISSAGVGLDSADGSSQIDLVRCH